jgi:hypothetical protein
MNEQLSSGEVDACLRLLERAFVLVRASCWSKDVERAEALADALHNLPRLLLESPDGWTIEGFERLFLDGLVERYPEYAGLRSEFRSWLAR